MTSTGDNRRTVLVVDDTPDNLSLMSGLLKDTYRVRVANGGERALVIARSDPQPDLILLDVMMPVMDGYEVCRQLKADPASRDIPVVFLTARTDQVDEQIGLELGAVDYITKPISPPIVVARVRNHLQLKHASDVLRNQNAFLEEEVERRTRDVRAIRDAAIVAMASLAETRDNETGNHIRRTQHYVGILADAMAAMPRFRDILVPETVDLLYRSAALHDIGKVGIPDSILLKPGRLTDEEFATMKTHTVLGYEALKSAERSLDNTDMSFLRYAREIALTHHERWDGAGYPQGLAGEAIPLSGRIMTVADVYDALISERVYKPAYPHEVAVRQIEDGRGTQFDPDVVDAFMTVADKLREISESFAD
ncbi:HD-GYP domain-containing protein [Thalassobaculum salexigens]|uniref:HD-GYP domain-containing protein n=1 Tax=Thalassobaculum salexigens TaxID=455360 RepID=UPI00248DA94C|nr:two-component system response regulator [Thalassobaculum salexigens]